MKNKLWLYQLPFIALCAFAFGVTELGTEGKLQSHFLRETLRPQLVDISSTFTDWKFRLRGPMKPKQPRIAIVAIDDESIAQLGRWPWHRDLMARLIDRIFLAGARVVGLDIVFSEEDERVSDGMQQVLAGMKLDYLKPLFETDSMLGKSIAAHAGSIILGWTPDGFCQPLYDSDESCPIRKHASELQYPDGFSKFAVSAQSPPKVDLAATPLISAFDFLVNLPSYDMAARHSGFFLATPDPDGVFRRTPLIALMDGKAYPSLDLEIARVILGDDVRVDFDGGQRIKRVAFEKSGRELPVSPVGAVEINARGPSSTYPYLSALDVLSIGENVQGQDRRIASENALDKLKDAYVYIGVTAVGGGDIRAFTFDKLMPGVEGHANILDNILSGDLMRRGRGWADPRWIDLLMIGGGLLFAFLTQKLEAIPALLLTLGSFTGIGLFDQKVLFDHGINWNLSFFYIELSAVFVFTVAAKYVMEEQSKKFVRGAFTKYVAPAVVDSILKDPARLAVGGEKRDLTILFSDIRGFTSFSEKMDAKALSSFLNDYLGVMTEIVFANEGTLDKYIGDAIMAFWGAPLDQPHHARNACRAAVQMREALALHRERFKAQYGVDVEIGIGLNTGVASVGNMGSNRNFAYTVIGDHVNLASRLEGLTKYYGTGIITSRFTFNSIADSTGEAASAIPHRVLDLVKVKGKENAVELIQVLDRPFPAEALRFFEEGRKAYARRSWDEASSHFRKADELIGGDGPCRLFIERCEGLKQQPPGPGWDGSWEMKSK